jgi:hypothetical protein
MGRGHPDVDYGQIGHVLPDEPFELSRVAGLPDDLPACASAQAGDAFPEKDIVVRYHQASGGHAAAELTPRAVPGRIDPRSGQ